MIEIRTHKIRLDPTPTQEEFFRKCVGTARFAYNYALTQWREQYKAGEKPSDGKLCKELNAIKREMYPWMYEVPKRVPQQAIMNLGEAFSRFFTKKNKYPKFKSKHTARQSARLDNGPGTFSFDKRSVKLPKIGRVKTFEEFRWPESRPISTMLRGEAGHWFLSVTVEIEKQIRCENQASVGIDLGLTNAITLSTGEKFQAPKPLKTNLEKLQRAQQKLSRKVKGSRNRKKQAKRVARIHWHIAQIRKDWTHKVTMEIASRFGLVCMEDLNVKGMVKTHHLARAVSDVGWNEIVRQLNYKTKVIRVDRFYPSSKLMACCGVKLESLLLSAREVTCPSCGRIVDRDHNAAINIHQEGQRINTVSCAGINACGEVGSEPIRKYLLKPTSMKQESIGGIITIGRTTESET